MHDPTEGASAGAAGGSPGPEPRRPPPLTSPTQTPPPLPCRRGRSSGSPASLPPQPTAALPAALHPPARLTSPVCRQRCASSFQALLKLASQSGKEQMKGRAGSARPPPPPPPVEDERAALPPSGALPAARSPAIRAGSRPAPPTKSVPSRLPSPRLPGKGAGNGAPGAEQAHARCGGRRGRGGGR